MSDPDPKDITPAFAHPELRAAATAGSALPDRISLRDYVVDTEIGAFQVERGLTQRLRFNLVVELAPQSAPGAATDDVDLILSYDRLSAAIDTELAGERLNLLETLAERIAARVLAEPQAQRCFVRIEKLDRGPWVLGVEIVRGKDTAAPAMAITAPHPVLAVLDPDAPDLDAVITRLTASHPALVLTLTPPALPRPAAATDAANLRITLLAIEQAAWAIAARHPALTVVASRTEIDWALAQSRAILWAPSKLMLDTVGAPGQVGDGLAPALWLADLLQASGVVLHADVAAPAESRIPVSRV